MKHIRMHERWNDVVQIDGRACVRDGEEGGWGIGAIRFEDALENQGDELYKQTLGKADDRHKDDGREQRRHVRLGVPQQAI
jgi:hypothetical protein